MRVTVTLLRLSLGPDDVTGAILLTAPVDGADPSADGAAASRDGAN